MTRPGALAVVAVVSAVLGGDAALGIGKAAGWLDGDGRDGPDLLVPTPDGATTAAERVGATPPSRSRATASIRASSTASAPRGRHDLRALRRPRRDGTGRGRAGLRLRRLRGRLHPHELPRRHDGRRGPTRARRPAPARQRLRAVSRRRARAGEDRRLGRVRRRRPAQGRPGGPRVQPRAARRLERGGRRRAGRGDRQPVRQRELAERRRRLGDGALDRLAHLVLRPRRRDPDRRADQPRQLGRPDVRRARAT